MVPAERKTLKSNSSLSVVEDDGCDGVMAGEANIRCADAYRLYSGRDIAPYRTTAEGCSSMISPRGRDQGEVRGRSSGAVL